jgi:hypothetical protein
VKVFLYVDSEGMERGDASAIITILRMIIVDKIDNLPTISTRAQ